MSSTAAILLLVLVVAVLVGVIWRDRANNRRTAGATAPLSITVADSVIAGAVDAIITSDGRGQILSFNRAAERMFGYDESDVVGCNLRILMGAPYRDQHDRYLRAYRETGVRKIIGIGREVECLRNDESVFWADLAVSETRTAQQRVFTGVIRDLTARKEAEATLASAVRRLNLALGAGGLIAWEYRSRLREFQFNRPRPDSDEQMLTPKIVSLEAAMERVHEADRARVRTLLSTGLPADQIADIEYRMRDRNGMTRWVHNHIKSVTSADGQREDWIGISRDVTKSKRTENRALTLGRILEESRNEIYVFDADSLRFALVNRCARDNLGYDSDELVTLTPIDLKRDMRLEEFHNLLEPLVDGSSSMVSFTSRHYRKDRSTYPVDVNIVRGMLDERPVYFAIILDITDQEHFLRRLRRKEEEHRLTVDYAPLGISTMNSAGVILAANRAALRMTGRTEGELIGRRGLRYVHKDDRVATIVAFERLVSGELPYTVVPHRLTTRNNDYVYVQTHYAVVHDSTGRPDKFIAMHQDLTDQQARENEIEEHREKLAHVSRLGTMGQMAAGLAHEINQPLAAISTYAQACQRLMNRGEPDREDLTHALAQVSKQTHRAGDVIRRMRALARGNQSVRETCHIGNLMTELIPLVDTDARHANVEIRLDLPADLPPFYADPVQIQQVLLNLVRNGIDAMRDLPSPTKLLVVHAGLCDEAGMRVSITDQGSGVGADTADKLFEPFFTTKKTGMGMGLSISRSIIKAHGGQIGYQPNPDGGSVFWFSIPTEDLKERT